MSKYYVIASIIYIFVGVFIIVTTLKKANFWGESIEANVLTQKKDDFIKFNRFCSLIYGILGIVGPVIALLMSSEKILFVVGNIFVCVFIITQLYLSRYIK